MVVRNSLMRTLGLTVIASVLAASAGCSGGTRTRASELAPVRFSPRGGSMAFALATAPQTLGAANLVLTAYYVADAMQLVRKETEIKALTIGQVVGCAGVGVETARFCERAGLTVEPKRRPSRYRQYPFVLPDRRSLYSLSAQ